MARAYLSRIRDIAERHGLLSWVDETIKANAENRCAATEDEVRILSRIVDEERVRRHDVPRLLGKSYRQCIDDETFEHLKTLPRVGIYDRLSVLLFAMKLKRRNKNE